MTPKSAQLHDRHDRTSIAAAALCIIAAFTCILFTSLAQASDWQYAGFAKIGKDDTFLFYDADSVQRPSASLVRYWLKSITRSNLERYYSKHEKPLVEKTAHKLVGGYVPRFYQLDAIRSQYTDATLLRD